MSGPADKGVSTRRRGLRDHDPVDSVAPHWNAAGRNRFEASGAERVQRYRRGPLEVERGQPDVVLADVDDEPLAGALVVQVLADDLESVDPPVADPGDRLDALGHGNDFAALAHKRPSGDPFPTPGTGPPWFWGGRPYRRSMCERILPPADGSAIVDVHTDEGTLYLVFHAPDMARLKAVAGDVRDAYDGVEVRRLLRSREDSTEQELVFVDSSTLADRQRDVLETAHEVGYFERPKGANAGEVAEALDITTSTFTEHLSAAQSKLFSAILDR